MGNGTEDTGCEARGDLLGGVGHIHQQLHAGAAGGAGNWGEGHGGGNVEGSVHWGGQG